MKLKIVDKEQGTPTLELWLEQDGEDVLLRSNIDGKGICIEFRIKPDRSWYKVCSGHLDEMLGGSDD